MDAIQDICEAHGQPLSWWDALGSEDQNQLLGRRNFRAKKAAKARKAAERRARRR